MPEDTYTRFISPDNFQLAWDLVRYQDRPDSKDRIGLKMFAANRDYNLEILRSSVANRVFEPSWPEIKYVPKPSMTLRPMAILATIDRIVYQAIGNVIAENGRSKLAVMANRQSFANVLSGKDRGTFFNHWLPQYKSFQGRYLELLEEGNDWIAETDIAAFYETIDHQMLYEVLNGGFLDEETLTFLKQYLPIWSAARNDRKATRGIPQGSLVSDLLANVYLYEFDQEFAAQPFYCLRYVDDIRLLGRSKETVQKGLIQVDKFLKGHSLLLQTKKTVVREVYSDLRDEVDRMAAQLSEIDDIYRNPHRYVEGYPDDPLLKVPTGLLALEDLRHDLEEKPAEVGMEEDSSETDILAMLDKTLEELFYSSLADLDNRSINPFAERHLKFALNRLQPTQEVTTKVLPLFVERPWLSDTIVQYLSKEAPSAEVTSTLLEVIKSHDVYDSIVSTAVRFLLRKQVSLRQCHYLFRQWLTEQKRHWSLLEAAALALGESEDNLPVLLQGLKAQSASVRRMCLIQSLRHAESMEMAEDTVGLVVSDPSPDVIIALTYLAYNEWNIGLSSVLAGASSNQDICISYAKGYDDSLPERQADYIRHVFTTRYSLDLESSVDFCSFMGGEYDRAVKFLWQAENSFLSNPSRYVAQLDLFHEELLFPIMVDKLQLKDNREQLAAVELSDRMKMLQKGKRELATLAGAMMACRELRRNPETHTRFHRELTYTNDVTWKQRDGLKKRLCGGYQELAEWIAKGYP